MADCVCVYVYRCARRVEAPSSSSSSKVPHGCRVFVAGSRSQVVGYRVYGSGCCVKVEVYGVEGAESVWEKVRKCDFWERTSRPASGVGGEEGYSLWFMFCGLMVMFSWFMVHDL